MKRQLASLLVLALCAASPIKAASATFYDVPSSHWAYEDIQQVAQKGILQGTGVDQNGSRIFEPQSPSPPPNSSPFWCGAITPVRREVPGMAPGMLPTIRWPRTMACMKVSQKWI